MKLNRCRAARLALGTMVGLGFGRFAYGLILPSMASELRWTLAQAGLLTTANGAGYLLGAASTAALVRRYGIRRIFRIGMVTCCVSLAVTGMSAEYAVLLVARVTAGAGGAFVFITGAVMCRSYIFFAGTGAGIVLSAVLVPAAVDHHPERWPLVWLGLAMMSVAATVPAWSAATGARSSPSASGIPWNARQLWVTGAAYFLFAAGYIAYVTFLGVLLQQRANGPMTATMVWSALGVSVVLSPIVLRPLAGWSPASRLVLALGGVAVSAGVVVLSQGAVVLAFSVFGYGTTFMAVPAAVAALVHDAVAPEAVTGAMSALTVVFALGQGLGPWSAGLVADATTPIATAAFTAVLCGIAGVVALVGSRMATSGSSLERVPATDACGH